MVRPPHSLKAGVFTRELITDKFVYGIFMGGLCLAAYSTVVFGLGSGDLGYDCNENFNDSCGLAYRARGTAYAILTVLLSVMALEAKHLTHSLFNLKPSSGEKWWQALTRNRFLLVAALVGLVTPVPILYLPVINHVVFRHEGLAGAEWGLVGGSLVCFVGLVEGWKAGKRRRGLGRKGKGEREGKGGGEVGAV